jgi:hypothetical protein
MRSLPKDDCLRGVRESALGRSAVEGILHLDDSSIAHREQVVDKISPPGAFAVLPPSDRQDPVT